VDVWEILLPSELNHVNKKSLDHKYTNFVDMKREAERITISNIEKECVIENKLVIQIV
jgi:hypothetical protein